MLTKSVQNFVLQVDSLFRREFLRMQQFRPHELIYLFDSAVPKLELGLGLVHYQQQFVQPLEILKLTEVEDFLQA
jgi:hypothetical protein